MELIGWMGGVLLALCGLPEFIKAVATKKCTLTWLFLGLWGVGEVLALTYVILKSSEIQLIPLLFNYGMNIAFIVGMIYYKIRSNK